MADPFAKFYNSGTWATLTLNVFSGAALLCAAAWFSFTLFSSRDAGLPPRVINSLVLEPTILLAGKPFTTHINVTLNRLCPYEVHWSLVRQTDNVEVAKIIEPVQQPPAQIGTQDISPSQRWVPVSVTPGEYKYISEVYDICPGGHTYTSVRTSIPITVR
jgi:hypothetical protein